MTRAAAKSVAKTTVKKPVLKRHVDTSVVRELNPRNADTSHLGGEPLITIQPDDHRVAVLVRCFNWYNHFYGKEDAKDLLVQYLDLHGRPVEAKVVKSADKSEFVNPLCWLARLSLRGLELTEHELALIENEITRLIKQVKDPEVRATSQIGGDRKKVVVKEVATNRPNVQEIMKERASEAAGELEGLFDKFLADGAKATNSLKIMDEVARKNVLPQHISIITDVWKRKRDEFEEVIKGKDAQLVQGYSRFSKTQLKNILKFIEQVDTDLNSYVSVKKASKSPRARKAVPVEKIVAKMKYMKAFKDPATKLDLTSLHPIKLHGASEAWVYDSAKRKLHHYVADEYSKTFSVKGNTLLGFDTKESEVKTLRKPAEQIKEIMGSKPAARKYFKDIKAVSTSPNGRFNDQMLILKAF